MVDKTRLTLQTWRVTMVNKNEANLVSFKILLTRDNKIVTEFSMLPEDMVDDIFPVDERNLIKTILRNGKGKLGDLHSFFQREMDVLKEIKKYI